jgi:hypothetical protein
MGVVKSFMNFKVSLIISLAAHLTVSGPFMLRKEGELVIMCK